MGWREHERWIDCSTIPQRIPAQCKQTCNVGDARHSRDAFDVKGGSKVPDDAVYQTPEPPYIRKNAKRKFYSVKRHESIKITRPCKTNEARLEYYQITFRR
jgi:hypothetical protein